jgi:hypothetical protein
MIAEKYRAMIADFTEGFRQNDYSNNVFLATQMNADLQTSLLAMSNSLSPEAKQQYQLLAASKDLENHYMSLIL